MKLIAVRSLDGPVDGPTVAVIHPTGRIGGTDDPDLVGRIRAALVDQEGVRYAPAFPGGLDGPAGSHDPQTPAWAIVVCAGLVRQGLAGDPIGYAFPDPEPGPPGAVYSLLD